MASHAARQSLAIAAQRASALSSSWSGGVGEKGSISAKVMPRAARAFARAARAASRSDVIARGYRTRTTRCASAADRRDFGRGVVGSPGHTCEVPAGVSPMLRVRQEIRDELRTHREILAEHTERFDRMERRQTESELRIATELVGVANVLRDVKGLLETRLDVRDRVVVLERRLDDLERRVPPAAE